MKAVCVQPTPLHWDMRLFTDFTEDTDLDFYRQGAEGRVFTSIHRIDGVRYAIKQVMVRERNLAAVIQECRLLATLHHPNIIRYHNCWLGPQLTPKCHRAAAASEDPPGEWSCSSSLVQHDGEVLTVMEPKSEMRIPLSLHVQMEFCPQTMRERLRDGEWPSWSERFEWAMQLCRGLVLVHSHNVCHGDIKSSNLLLSERQVVKIADFGMTTVPSYGTVPYSSPEQSQEGVPSTAADVFSVGILLVELTHPYSTEMERSRHLQAVKDDCSSQPPLVQACLSKCPLKRPTARQLLAGLEKMVDR